mmetsp:Transcript_6189/g.9333  ORF Transcript_6189/g.9333 Transcript_6189/m.9333 type:complete len:1082 (-) Transcript_6189:109-3354(-)
MNEWTEIYAMGDNRYGQLGNAYGDDAACHPVAVESIKNCTVCNFSLTSNQSHIVGLDGVLLNCGENDQNELGRTGKRSLFSRVDALEAFSVCDIAAGNGYCVVALSDGRVMSWGRNDLGQLGNGNRLPREKPRFNTGLSHRIIQLSAGAEHVIALTSAGHVLAWGGNRVGQLGDGQFTSSSEPKPISELRHRPITGIVCGHSHSIALTVGGDVYSWGENSQGQLGLGDRKNRLRPEIVRALKAAVCVKVSAGGHHSLAISHPQGLLFAFGSNSHGQLGQGHEESSDASSNGGRTFPSPVVVDRLRDKQVIDATCGSAHSLVVCRARGDPDDRTEAVYAMGLNTSGQCGLGNFHSTPRPTLLSFHSTRDNVRFTTVHSNCLALHSFVQLSSHGDAGRKSLPSVNHAALALAIERWTINQSKATLQTVREMVAESFSSIAALNASFRVERRATDILTSGQPTSSVRTSIELDLQAVRETYQLILSSNCDKILNTLGRATLLVTEQLRDCQFDTAENLYVFLIVLENPLLLKPELFHVALERLVSGILAIPKSYRVMFFGWLKYFPSEHFARILSVLQGYLSFTLESHATNLDPTPVVLVMDSLFACNSEAKIVPPNLFYNVTISKALNIHTEWYKYKTTDVSRVFNFFSYPFLVPVEAKNEIIRSEFRQQMQQQVVKFANKYVLQSGSTGRPMPRGVFIFSPLGEDTTTPKVGMHLKVDRQRLLPSLLSKICEILSDDPSVFLLPLSVEFEGEEGVDEGGLSKELLTLAVREFISFSPTLHSCGIHGEQLWFTRTEMHATGNAQEFPDEFLLGILVGLACYNGILVNLPIVPVVYKLFYGREPNMEDLWAADSGLANSLQIILDFDKDGCSLADIFGATFAASANPLLDNGTEQIGRPAFIDLKEDGQDIYVDRGNRKEFVDLFVRHALHGSCRTAIHDFISGLKVVLHTPALGLCTHTEIEHVICGSPDVGDITMLRQNTTYLGVFSDTHPVVVMFWETLGTLSVIDQRRFLFFVSASDRVPIGGIKNMRLTIQPTSQGANALPAAHTCFNILDLPVSYTSVAELRERLLLALEHSQGFGLA